MSSERRESAPALDHLIAKDRRQQPDRHATFNNYLKTKRFFRHTPELRIFEQIRKPDIETLTETGRSRISRANCPR